LRLAFVIDAVGAALGARHIPALPPNDQSEKNGLAPGGCPGVTLVRPHIHDVHIGAEPDVVSQVPAIVVGIFVNHDIVAIPKPVAAITDVEGAGEVSMLPGMIEMIVDVGPAGVVADPLAVVMNVGSIGMPRLVVEMLGGLRRMRRARRSWTMRRDVGRPTPNIVSSSVLTKGRERK
jgi:hypothetical protein